jgi:hypothetical protein
MQPVIIIIDGDIIKKISTFAYKDDSFSFIVKKTRKQEKISKTNCLNLIISLKMKMNAVPSIIIKFEKI